MEYTPEELHKWLSRPVLKMAVVSVESGVNVFRLYRFVKKEIDLKADEYAKLRMWIRRFNRGM